jgi:hypothetical protein
MNQIVTLSDDADQQVFYALPDGTVATLQFTYRAGLQRWSFSVSYTGPNASLDLNGVVLCVHPNTLRQWKNLIPFGMAVVSLDGYDPVALNDFTTGRIQIFMLTQSEVAMVESQVIGQAA